MRGLIIGAGMQRHEIRAGKRAQIGVGRRSRIGNAFALRGRNVVPALLADLRDKSLVDIECDHRNVAQPGKLE